MKGRVPISLLTSSAMEQTQFSLALCQNLTSNFLRELQIRTWVEMQLAEVLLGIALKIQADIRMNLLVKIAKEAWRTITAAIGKARKRSLATLYPRRRHTFFSLQPITEEGEEKDDSEKEIEREDISD